MDTILKNKTEEELKREKRMKKLLDQMFNKKVKEKFLNEYLEEDETRESYAVYLLQASLWEKNINKDLYSFNREDVLDLCSDNFTTKHTALRIFYSVCKQYVNWAISKKYVKTMINPFDLVKFNKHILPMLNVKGMFQTIISEEELWDIINGFTNEDGEYIEPCMNAQDKICLILPFYFKGEKCSELTNLKKQDIDYENNKITVINNKDIIREVQLPKEVMDILKQASQELEYYSIRKREDKEMQVARELYDNDYVFRPIKTGRKDVKETGEPTATLIFGRAKKALTKANYGKMSINDIFMSGKLKILNDIYEKNGKIEIKDYKEVQKTFGDSENNYSNLKTLYELVISEAD